MVFSWKRLRLQRPMKNPAYSRAAVGWPRMKEMEILAEFYNPEKLYNPHMIVSMDLTMIRGERLMDEEMVGVLYRRSHEHLREVECRLMTSG